MNEVEINVEAEQKILDHRFSRQNAALGNILVSIIN